MLTKELMIDQSEIELPIQTADYNDNQEQSTVIDNQSESVVTEHQATTPPIRTSNRVRQRPKYLQDYVCSMR
jgi:hypothetical protein